MLGFNRWHLIKLLVAILSIVGIASLALIYFIPAPPSKISIATAFKGGAYELFGHRYREMLAKSRVNLDVLLTTGSLENLRLLQDKKSDVQVAFVQGGISNGKQEPGVLSLGRINYQVIWLFYRAADTFDQLTQLKGKRVAVGQVGSATQIIVQNILAASGVTPDNTTLSPLFGAPAITALNEGKVDVVFLAVAPDAPIIQSLLRDSNIRLMSLQRADALTRIFPFLVKVVMPQGVIDLANNIPATDVTLIATTNAILVRKDLNPATITLLAHALAETHSEAGLFQRAGEFPTQTDPEFPMAEGAVDFYKNGLPLLNKYLPHWIVPHVQRLLAALLAGGAIAFPLFSFAPKLFKSLVEYRLGSMYRRLRVIEASLQKCASPLEVSALETELESVDREIHLLGVPMQHSDLFFSIKSHLDDVRAHLRSSRAKLSSQTTKAA
jgi:TRAP transporter TAXI family solute receptor